MAIVKQARENYESLLPIEEVETTTVFGMEPPMPSSVRTILNTKLCIYMYCVLYIIVYYIVLSIYALKIICTAV